MTQFSELGLAAPFLRATAALNYHTATPIQAAAIPVVLAGHDLMGCAQTGTGKTAAFTLPMLDRLMQTLPPRAKPPASSPPRERHSSARTLRALVLSPTRELAAQIGDSLQRYGRFTPLRHTVVFGGVSQFHQVKALRHGVDALVATPGRLLDLMQQGYIDLSQIEILVFDEADQMLDMGFLPDLKRIVAAVPEQRQTLMFSATMPPAIRQLAQQWLQEPAAIEVAPVATPAERITQTVHFVDKGRKTDLLARLLKDIGQGRTIVFSRTKHGADKIVTRLKKDGFHAAAIHGNKSQGARNRALAQFKSKRPPVLVATDIAARGLDINEVSHVVNFDLPDVAETYVHRIGRTARAGATGVAVAFCAGEERGLLRQIERLTKQSISVEPTLAGFEPTEPIREAPRRGGGQRSEGRRPSGAGPAKKKFRPKSRPAAKTSAGDAAGDASGTGAAPYRKKNKKKFSGSTLPRSERQAAQSAGRKRRARSTTSRSATSG